jgi:hypothetical protein
MGLSAEAVVQGLRGALFRDTIPLRRARADRRRYMNAAKYGLDRVFFSGCFIRGERGDATSPSRETYMFTHV